VDTVADVEVAVVVTVAVVVVVVADMTIGTISCHT